MKSLSINLLPPLDRTRYRKHRRVVILSRAAVGVGILTIVVAVFGVAAWRYAAILADTERARRAALEHSEGLVLAKQFEEKLVALSEELEVVRDLQRPQYDPNLIILDLVRTLPASAKLQTLTLKFESGSAIPGSSSAKGGGPAIFLSGEARSRADVLEYQHALEGLSYVEDVEAPIENILKPFETDFTFSLLLKPLIDSAATAEDAPVSRLGGNGGTSDRNDGGTSPGPEGGEAASP